MSKILSVIIPTYNMEKYLHRCLDSLIMDEYMDKVEVLVINDGSKDSSSKIAHEYQEKYPETFRVIDKENGNYGSCINRGLKEATGKYVKILDADDWYDSVSLKKFVGELNNIDVDLVFTDFVTVREQGGEEADYKMPYKENAILSYSEIEKCLLENYIAMHAVTYKKDNLLRIQYRQTEGISYTDQEWIFLPMTTVKYAYYVSMPLYKYLVGREGQTMSAANMQKSVSQNKIIAERMLKQLRCVEDVYHNYLISRILFVSRLIYNYAILGNSTASLPLLEEFDSSLAELSPKVYAMLDDEKTVDRIHFSYIRDWRRVKSKHKLTLKNRIYKYIKCINK